MARDLYTILYMSVATAPVKPGELANLLVQSRRFNSENGITGLLIYVNEHWIEFLEGERKSVEEVMVRIGHDPRHREIEVIEKGPVATREFQDWSMAFLEGASPEIRALPGYSTFLEDPLNWETPGPAGRGLELLNYFKVIMLASDDFISNLAQSAEIRQRSPVLAGKLAAAKRRS